MGILQQWLGNTDSTADHPVAQRLFSWWLPNSAVSLEEPVFCGFARQPGRCAAFTLLPDRQTIILIERAEDPASPAPSWELVNPTGTFCFTRHGGIRLESPEPGGEQLALRSRWLNLADNTAILGVYGGDSWTLQRSAGITGLSRDGFLWTNAGDAADCATLLITGCTLNLADSLGRESAALRLDLPGEPADQGAFVRSLFCTGRDGKTYLFAANLAPAPTGKPSERQNRFAHRCGERNGFLPQTPGNRWKRLWPKPAASDAEQSALPLFPGDCGLWTEE